MHGCGHVNAPLVNAEVDSMGGVIDSGVGIGIRSTPLRAAIEKAQAELRLEYDAREERKRELEFLENGGNPLDFKFGNAASVSVQSTSLTDRPPEQLLTSEAKGSFALTTSPHGDSVESSGRPDAPVVSEPNCADNLLLSDGENGSADGRRNSVRCVPNKIALSEQTSQLDGSQNAKESGESGVFGLPKSQAYKRRNRSRPNREGGRSNSTNIVPSRGDHVSSLPSCSGQQEVKGSVLDTDNQKNCYLKPTISNVNMAPYDLPSNGVVNMVLDNGQAVESTIAPIEVGLPKLVLNCEKDLVASQRSEDVGEEPSEVRCEIPDSVDGKQLVVSPRVDCSPSDSAKPDNQAGSAQKNGLSDAKGDGGKVPDEGQNCSTTLTIKSLDSEFYCTRNSFGLDRTPDSIPSNGLRNEDFKENTREEILICSVALNLESDEKLKAKNENKTDDRCSPAQDEHSSISESNCRDFSPKPEEELHESRLQEEVKHIISVEGMKVDGITALEIEGKLDDLDPAKENVSSGRLGGSTDESAHDNRCTEKENAFNRIQDPSVPGLLSETAFPSRDSSDTNKHKISTETQMKLEVRTHENSILKEARFIEAKRKRISQLAVGAFAFENRQKSHWDFILEEMAWLANDFAQERLWKVSAAAQLSHQIASTSRERLAEKSSLWKQKKVAHTLSKAIMEFWLSAEELGQGTTMQCPGRNSGVHEYAARYVKNDTSRVSLRLAEAPVTPERISDLGSQELRLEEQLTDDNLFYTVPPGAMEAYRKDGESHLAQVEKTSSSIQEEVETSVYDAAADLVSQGNAYEKDEGETNTYLLSGDTESGKPSKFALKKRILIKSSSARSCDMGADSSFVQCMENKFGTLQSGQTAKRPVNNLRVSANPPKRMRTASRPRFTPPFTAGTSGGIQVPNKTDGSSGDTNSFQDNQSTFHGISQNPNNMEVESVADFERQLPFDSAEVSKPKKKKPKHLGSTNEHRWRLENKFQNEPGGYSRKRFDKFVESNGSSGLSGQHVMKKQKLTRQPMNNSIDNYSPLVVSIPSSVTSQMSNMSNSKKLVKILGGRDRGRKSKSLKMPVGQIGPGSPWSSFEEQALIVLVHDLGPNWELISDAINNILQYKCIFRKPKECSEHHKELISRTVGDGADSAEDSGSSQPYPSTLPGIPKGSARALFQRLQEPIEEDMIKFHFEKIIVMSQQEHYRKMQNENQDQKPIQPHSSHALALSQVCPNNINGGPVLTPLDLCDTTDPSPDVLSGGYQGTHGGGLSVSNQGGAASLPSTSAANSSARGSPNTVHGKSFSTPSHPLSSLMRDGRFSGLRSASLSVDEHQRVQQYNQMMPGRVYGTPLGTGRGGRLMAGGNGMGVMSGLNRNMTITRPGFPGIAPSSDPNSGSMLPSNMAVMTGPGNMHSGVGAGSGNSMLRSRDSLNMIRPGQIPDHQRQMMAPDLQMPAVQGNIQGAAPFGGLSSGLSNQTSPPSSQTHHFHHQQQHPSSPQQSHVHNNPHHPHLQGPNHVSSSQHQARVFRFAKERQLKLQEQHLLPQRQLAASGDMMPSGPPEPQGFVQNNSHVQPQSSASVSATLTPSSSMPPMSQNQLKPHMPPNGLARNQQSGANQTGKQRQRQSQQQLQNSNPQTGRQHPQQWAHPQLHAKLVKGAGRVNMAIHQTSSVDSSILNGLCPTTGSQSTEKAERIINTMQGQGLYPGSGLNPRLPSNQRLIQERKLYSGQAIASSKQVQLPKHLDNNALGQASPSISGNALPTSRQATSPSFTSSKSQLMQPSLKLANTSQPPVQRVLQHNHQSSTDSLPSKLLADQDQSEQQHVSSSSSPPQLGTSAVHHEPYVEQVSVEHVVSTSGTQWREAEQMQSLIVPKPAVQSASVGSPLTSLHRTQSQGSAEGQVSVSLPPKGLDTGTQRHPRQPQLQTSSSPPQQKQQPVPAQQLQAGNSNFYANARSADNRLE